MVSQQTHTLEVSKVGLANQTYIFQADNVPSQDGYFVYSKAHSSANNKCQ